MKNLFALLFALLLCTLFLAACDENDDGGKPTHTHAWSEWEETEAPTCKDGEETRTCACGEEETRVLDAIANHSYGPGNRCTVCNSEYKYTEGLAFTEIENGTAYAVSGIGAAATEAHIVIPYYYENKPVTAINSDAFYQCAGLVSVSVPASVSSIGAQAFVACPLLTGITLEPGNTAYHMAKNCLIETATKTLVAGFKNSEIPADGSVTRIGTSAFLNCSWLTSITIPASVSSIEAFAFSTCSNLETVTFAQGSQLASIGQSAFVLCSNLQSITLPASVSSIGITAFANCAKLETVAIDDYESSRLELIDESAFSNCESLISITVPASVKTISSFAFSGCSKLVLVTFLENSWLENIGMYIFYDCPELSRIQYHGTVAKWQAINKDPHWIESFYDYTVVCTDGEIAKDGTVTMYAAQ